MDKLRVWWIPQAGATEEAFYVPVETVEEGKKVMDMLAAYDAYQRQNRIKPDYYNCFHCFRLIGSYSVHFCFLFVPCFGLLFLPLQQK